MHMCSKILYRKTQFHCEHGKPRNIGHAISLLNPYIICIVPDLASITDNSRFVDPNHYVINWAIIPNYFINFSVI